jgi:DNA-binding NarL/FixJ family response regulator
MAEGHSNAAICERLYISAKTLENHVSRIFAKLDLPPCADQHRRVTAVLVYLRS